MGNLRKMMELYTKNHQFLVLISNCCIKRNLQRLGGVLEVVI